MEENQKPGEENKVTPEKDVNTPVTPVDSLVKPVISFRPAADDRDKYEKILRYQQRENPDYTLKQMFSDMLKTLNILGYWKAEDIK